MDKKSIAIGVAVLVAALGLLFWNGHNNKGQQAQNPPAPAAAVVNAPAAQNPAPAASQTPQTAQSPAATASSASAPAPTTAEKTASGSAPSGTSVGEEAVVTLANEDIRLHIALAGGGLESVALLRHADALEHRHAPANTPFLFNAPDCRPSPATLALGFRSVGGDDPNTGLPVTNWTPKFRLVSRDARSVVIAADIPAAGANGAGRITRTFTLADPAEVAAGRRDPHLVSVRTEFAAAGGAPFAFPPFRLNIGALPPTGSYSDTQFLGVDHFDGESFHKTAIGDLAGGSGFLGIGASAPKTFVSVPAGADYGAPRPLEWVACTNQYFAGILRLEPEARKFLTTFRISQLARPPAPGAAPAPFTVTGDLGFALPAAQPGQPVSLAAEYFVGPREYSRLANLGHGQEKAVQFASLFWVISVDPLCKAFTVVLDFLHSLFPAGGANSWGFAIILLTIIIKALTWPLVTAQQRSAEKMRKFQGPMKAIREKFKDDPKRMQQETMKLYQENKINPFAGCLPVLIQIPVFTGLFFTFQSLAQLRFQSFLWIPDLAMPDVIPGLETVFGFPLHILPLFMGATMLLNMKLTPMPNVEGQQKMIFYGMMVMFPVLCYGMPSALMLYYSVQNVLTIFQTFVTRRRMRLEEARAAAEPVAANVVDFTAGAGTAGGAKKKRKK